MFIFWWSNALGISIVIHLHGADYPEFLSSRSPASRGLIRAMFHQASLVLVLGQEWRRFAIEQAGARPACVQVLYNGVPLPKPRAVNRQEEKAKTPHILFLGRLGDRKGTTELIEALASPDMRAIDWRATLAGDGDVERYRAMARERGIGDRIAFPGWVGEADVETLLAEATMLVLPSHAEGLPMSVIEGLAWSLPVITTPVGSIPELLTDGETALLVPVGDAISLSRALARLSSDRALCARLGAAGHRVFQQNLAIETVASAYLDAVHALF